MIQKLPPRRFVISDNAYVCSETLLTPFSANEKKDPAKDAFNFYLSQLRICIEQTFGLMSGKWRILRQPLQMKLKNAAKVFMCITRLHNFIINEGNISINNSEDCVRELVLLNDDESGIVGSSVLRNMIMQDLVNRRLESQPLGK